MSTMNEFLSQFYGTNTELEEKTASSNDEQVAMFAKLASDNGIDLSQLNDEQLETLYTETFSKQAGEIPPQFRKTDGDNDGKVNDGKPSERKERKEEKDDDEKKASAERLEKQAQEADFMGRIIAHSYVNELRKIAADAEAKTASVETGLRDRLLKVANAKAEDDKNHDGKKDKDQKGEKKMPPWMKDKEASALNEAAAQHAMELLSEYNKTASEQFDLKVAVDRLAAVHTLGLGDSEKVASAVNAETATQIRALEYLESAGYPVKWS